MKACVCPCLHFPAQKKPHIYSCHQCCCEITFFFKRTHSSQRRSIQHQFKPTERADRHTMQNKYAQIQLHKSVSSPPPQLPFQQNNRLISPGIGQDDHKPHLSSNTICSALSISRPLFIINPLFQHPKIYRWCHKHKP